MEVTVHITYATLGAIVVTAARDVKYLLGGRFIIGFGVSIAATGSSAYVVEMSPPQVRASEGQKEEFSLNSGMRSGEGV